MDDLFATHDALAVGELVKARKIGLRELVDGSIAHLQNWIDCVRSRQKPNAHIRVAHQAARTSHLANASLRSGKVVRWNAAREKIES